MREMSAQPSRVLGRSGGGAPRRGLSSLATVGWLRGGASALGSKMQLDARGGAAEHRRPSGGGRGATCQARVVSHPRGKQSLRASVQDPTAVPFSQAS